MIRRLPAVLAVTLALLTAAPGSSQSFRYLAFGDSITLGIDRWDELGLGGYPGRLHMALGCNGTNCEVDNQGLGGESTGEGLTRIDDVLAARRYDVMLLMEGTNDLRGFSPLSVETVAFNLDTMADKAAARGVETMHIVPPHYNPNAGGWTPGGNDQLDSLRTELTTLTGDTGREYLSHYSLLCPNGTDWDGHSKSVCFNTEPELGPKANQHYYWPACDKDDPLSWPDPLLFPDFDPFDPKTGCDQTGHPNASGFQGMVDERFLLRIETDRDPPGAPVSLSPQGDVDGSPTFTWDREDPGGDGERTLARWYQIVVEENAAEVASDWIEAAGSCNATTCSASLANPLPAADLTWKVQGRNVAGRSAFGASLAIRAYPNPPAKPTGSAPAGDFWNAGGLDPEYRWTSVGEAAAYDLEVRDSGGLLVVSQSVDADVACAGSSCALTTGAVLGQDDYTWQVRGTNPAGSGSFSADLSFSVYTSAPASPATLQPDDTARWYRPLYETSPLFTWEPVAGATSYSFQVDGANDTAVDASSCSGSTCSLRSPVVLDPFPHDWRVRAANPLGVGPYSAAPRFVIQFCGAPQVLDPFVPDDPQGDDRVFEACEGVATAQGGTDFEVGSPVVLHARDTVVLTAGTRLGGTFVIVTDP